MKRRNFDDFVPKLAQGPVTKKDAYGVAILRNFQEKYCYKHSSNLDVHPLIQAPPIAS